jgi:hypothetical protein
MLLRKTIANHLFFNVFIVSWLFLMAIWYGNIAVAAVGVDGSVSSVEVSKLKKEDIQGRQITWISGGFYSGKFDDGVPLQINLQFPSPGQLWGSELFYFSNSYWNPRDVESSKTVLNLIAEDSKHFEVEGRVGGNSSDVVHFNGKWSNNFNEIDGRLARTSEGRVRKFHATLRIKYQTELQSWLASDAEEYGNRPSVAVATYPLLSNSFPATIPTLGLTKRVAKYSNTLNSQSDAELSSEMLIAWASDRLVIFSNNQSFYGFGAPAALNDVTFSSYKYSDGAYKEVHLDSYYEASERCERILMCELESRLIERGVFRSDVAMAYISSVFEGLRKNDSNIDDSFVFVSPMDIEFYFGSNSLGGAETYDVIVKRSRLHACASRFPRYEDVRSVIK